MSLVYLDHAASTPMSENALLALDKASRLAFANPSAQHRLGRSLAEKIEHCRGLFREELGAKDDDQIIFTSSATESNNMIFRGLNLGQDDLILYSPGDHPSLVEPAKALASQGVHLHTFSRDQSARLIFDSTADWSSLKLAVFSHVNNHNGTLVECEKLARTIKKSAPNCHVHIDMAQSFGKLPPPSLEQVDSLTLAAHKMGGPKGIGALVLKSSVKLSPLFFGGGHESGLRSATPATPLILSWTTALADTKPHREKSLFHIQKINDEFRQTLAVIEPKIKFLFSLESTSPYILTAVLPGILSDVFLRHFEEAGFVASSSSACSSRAKSYSPVFADLGVAEEYHKNILRFSFAPSTTSENLEKAAKAFRKITHSLDEVRNQQ